MGSWLTQSSSMSASSGRPGRGMRPATAPIARATGAPKVRWTINGVKASAQPSSALSSTGISISSPLTRSGAATAASREVLAPSEVPPITAWSISRWSSRAMTWPPKIDMP